MAEIKIKPPGASAGIQSVDVALGLLGALSRCGGAVSLSDLARRCDMPPSKAHRYLASFMAAGLVVQAGRSGKYDLGPMAMEIGLAALSRHNFVNRASDALPELRDATGMTVLLSVWGSEGATVVRWERAASPVITSMGLGTTLPLLTSASGRIFLAWLPPESTREKLKSELAVARKNPAFDDTLKQDDDTLSELRREIRNAGCSGVDGRFIPGLVAVAAPILDWQGEAQCAITLIGTDPALIRPDSVEVERLKAFCHSQSMNPLNGG
ncbi:MAG: IclR family transcriptional regulator [Roseovarius sp.]